MKKVLAALCAVFLIIGANTAVLAEDTPGAVLNVRNSVVRILAATPNGIKYGSGFAIGSTYPISNIVTNYHIVDGAEKINVIYSDNTIEASVIETFEDLDLAILNLSDATNDLAPVTINDKTANGGTDGYLLGYSINNNQTSSILTEINSNIHITNVKISSVTSVPYLNNKVNVYQIKTTIDPGISGGPLVNSDGEVIGISSWNDSGALGINAVIRIHELVSLLNEKETPIIKSQSISIIKWILLFSLLILVALVILLVILVFRKNKKCKGVLLGINGEFKDQKFIFGVDEITIGRDVSQCNVILSKKASTVSRIHCSVKFNPKTKTFALTDLNSANGTFIGNDIKLKPNNPTILHPDDTFYIGEKSNIFKVGIEI